MIHASRRLLAVPAVLTAVLTLSACGDSPVRTGAAATVGSTRFTTSTLDDLVEAGLKDPQAQQSAGADKPAYQRTVLSRLITHQLVTVAADSRGVSVDGSDVDAAEVSLESQVGGAANLQSQAVKAGLTPTTLRQALSDFALRDKLSDELTSTVPVPEASLRAAYQADIATFDQVDSAHILVKTKALADQLLAMVKKDPSTFAALAAKYSTDTASKSMGGELGYQGRGALAKAFETAIFTHSVGSFVEAHTQFGYHVIHVEGRHTTSFTEAVPQLRRQLLTDQRTAAVTALITSTAKKLGVHVNPRFGTWDVSKLDVEPAVDTLSSPSPGPAGASPAATDGSTTP